MHILLPTFLFPPFSNPGSIRLARFVKHFVNLGAKTTVVCGSVDDYVAGFPRKQALDSGLLDTLPSKVEIFRTRSIRPGRTQNWFVQRGLARLIRFAELPDNTRRWTKIALDVCEGVIERSRPDVIYTSSNPVSGHIIGYKLSRKHKIPWVAEFRDPWTTNPYKVWQTRLHFYYERHLQAKFMNQASFVVMNTPTAKQQLLEACDWIPSEKVHVVTNSFAPKAKTNSWRVVTPPSDQQMLVAHVGTMRCIRPPSESTKKVKLKTFLRMKFNSVWLYRPKSVEISGNSPWYVLSALRKLFNELPDLSGKIQIGFAGRLASPKQESEFNRLIKELDLEDSVEYLGQLPLEHALGLMHEADVLLLNQVFLLDESRCPIVAAKTYEYLAMKKPILGLLGPGDALDFVKQSGWGRLAPPDDVTKISKLLKEMYYEHITGEIAGKDNESFIEQFRSDLLAKKVWHLMIMAISGERIQQNPGT